MMKNEVLKKVEELKGTDKMKDLMEYMVNNGVEEVDSWLDKKEVDKNVSLLLNNYFDGKNTVVTNDTTKNGKPQNKEDGKEVDFDEIKNLKKLEKNAQNANDSKTNTVDTNNNKPVVETPSMIKRKYKTIDNLIDTVESKDTTLSNVRKIDGETYSLELTGADLASMFLDATLVYDPTMQRGYKEDKSGNMKAVFRDSHIKEISEDITNGDFQQLSQIHLALIVDDEDLNFIYNNETNSLEVHGKIRLLDGQHRTKACVKIYCDSMADCEDEDSDYDLNSLIFSVVVHAVSSDRARQIYGNLNKNLKLDKSQVRQLQNDFYANIINELNRDSNSDLHNKISLSRPVGSRIVLFNVFAEALQKNVVIDNSEQKEEVKKYLNEFFKHVATKLPQAFSSIEDRRKEFRKNNLLNENNFFPIWIKIAFMDKTNYKKNIDKIARNISFFNKDYKEKNAKVYFWEDLTVVKKKVGKTKTGEIKGFAMNNSKTGSTKLVEKTLELLKSNKYK